MPEGGEGSTTDPNEESDESEAGWFFQWSPDDSPGYVEQVGGDDGDAGWSELRNFYCPLARSAPFERIVKVAEELCVRSVVVERRYIDLDYRSEHSHFYSTTFKRFPSICHRLHFFAEEVESGLKNLDEVAHSYRGYSVMRPLPGAPVGRTMIAPPPSLAGATLCLAVDTTHLWGRKLSVRAMPFVSQDKEYLRCAHSSLWMMLYHAYLRHGMPRRLPNEIYQAALGGAVTGRRLPSEGLSPGQVVTALHQMNMSSGHIRLPTQRQVSQTRHATSLFGIIGRYVNSQMPPMVYSENHAWVVVGYKTHDPEGGHNTTTLFVHNDMEGPYLRVSTPFVDELDPKDQQDPGSKAWKAAVPPMSRKLYMTGERAEIVGRHRLMEFAKESREGQNSLSRMPADKISWRSYAVQSYEFKVAVRARLPTDIAILFELSHLPRWIWVVEAHDKRLVKDNRPSLLGEVVIDATASQLARADDPVVLLRHITGEAFNYTPDHGEIHRVIVDEIDPYQSGQIVDDGQVHEGRREE